MQTGQFESDALVFRSEFAAGGMKLKLRNVTQLSATGKILSEQYVTAEGAPEKLMVRVEANVIFEGFGLSSNCCRIKCSGVENDRLVW